MLLGRAWRSDRVWLVGVLVLRYSCVCEHTWNIHRIICAQRITYGWLKKRSPLSKTKTLVRVKEEALSLSLQRRWSIEPMRFVVCSRHRYQRSRCACVMCVPARAINTHDYMQPLCTYTRARVNCIWSRPMLFYDTIEQMNRNRLSARVQVSAWLYGVQSHALMADDDDSDDNAFDEFFGESLTQRGKNRFLAFYIIEYAKFESTKLFASFFFLLFSLILNFISLLKMLSHSIVRSIVWCVDSFSFKTLHLPCRGSVMAWFRMQLSIDRDSARGRTMAKIQQIASIWRSESKQLRRLNWHFATQCPNDSPNPDARSCQ